MSTQVSQTFMSLGPFITKQRLFKKVNIFCFLADIFSKEKLLTFRIFNESNIWAYWKIEVSESVNSIKQHFEICYQKKYLLKGWNFLVYPQQNDGSAFFFFFCEIERIPSLNGLYFQTPPISDIGLMKIHNMSKIKFGQKPR